jgi:hypothetical protein
LRLENGRKIGKVDYLLARLGTGGPTDFAALEVQAVYFSGANIRPAMDFFLRHRRLDPQNCARRPDYRSCAQKRLMPQLALKVPVFRRWGKKFFVVVDSLFFAALPTFRTVAAANTEVTWLSYPIAHVGPGYTMQDPAVTYTLWDDVLDALREGQAPDPAEIIEELRRRMDPARVLLT